MEVVRRRLAEKRYRPRTADAYVHWIRRYVVFHDRRHPGDLSEEHVRTFLSDLATTARVAAATQNQALAALTFLYEFVIERPLTRIDGITPARRPLRVPVVLSQHEMRALLRELREPTRLCSELRVAALTRFGSVYLGCIHDLRRVV
jgi:site-specific recombinase XerD